MSAPVLRRDLALALLPNIRAAREAGVSSLAFAEAAINAEMALVGDMVASVPIEHRNTGIAAIARYLPEWVEASEQSEEARA